MENKERLSLKDVLITCGDRLARKSNEKGDLGTGLKLVIKPIKKVIITQHTETYGKR